MMSTQAVPLIAQRMAKMEKTSLK